MTELRPTLTLWGEKFSPCRAEEVTGVVLSRKHEPGEIGLRGRFAGTPLPNGGAFLEAPAEVKSTDRIAWLLKATACHLGSFRQAGATICKFHLDVLYWDQCNLCFTSEELATIAALGINFTISCYDHTGSEEPA